jgi:hypothetical protein
MSYEVHEMTSSIAGIVLDHGRWGVPEYIFHDGEWSMRSRDRGG